MLDRVHFIQQKTSKKGDINNTIKENLGELAGDVPESKSMET